MSAYFLAPDKGGAKPYSLLATALKKAKQCAVGRWISRGKEHIVILRPMDAGLAMHQLHFKAEVRTIKELGVEAAPISDVNLAELFADEPHAVGRHATSDRAHVKGKVSGN